MPQQRIDGDAVLKDVDIVAVISKYQALKKSGSFFKGLCPFHNDHAESLEVIPRKQIFKCHACGAGGDAIEYLRLKGHKFREAVSILRGEDASSEVKPEFRQSKPRTKSAKWTPTVPNSPPEHIIHREHGKPSMVWKWHSADGKLLSYTCRFDFPDGTKDVLPYTYCTNGTKSEWRWQGMAAPQVLYNLHKLAQYPDAVVILVEGEKTAEALDRVVGSDKVVVSTWVGGANGISRTDWSPLAGRKVLIWPDYDWEGVGAAIQIGHIIDSPSMLKWIGWPQDAPRKWDFADCDWDTERTRAWVNANLSAPQAPESSEKPKWADACDAWWLLREPSTGEPARYLFLRGGKFYGQRIPDAEKSSALPVAPEVPSAPSAPETTSIQVNYQPPVSSELPPDVPFSDEYGDEPMNDAHFTFLGFEKSETSGLSYYFFVKRTRNVVRISNSSLSKTALYQLAPLSWWESQFHKRKGFDLDMAADFIISNSQMRGMFSGKNIRGRGAWLDNGRVVLHVGDYLIVDNKRVELGSLDSKFIYERGEHIDLEPGAGISSAQASKLVDMLEMISWERPVAARLLAGWCVIAPFCGALKWRPHIWVTGSAGTGKSWVMNKIIRSMLGSTVIDAQGNTTESGLRQLLGSDAMPVEFDEAEGEGRVDAQRMQDVLALARAASTDDGGKIIKGTAGHQARTFSIRSCFAFSSITPQVSGQADRSRVTMLQIRKEHDVPKRKANWEKLQRMHTDVMNEAFVRGVHQRTMKNLKTILANATTFANAAAAVIGEQRTGDQLGAMLAGAYSLYRSDRITFDAAVEWLKKLDWAEERSLENTKDEVQLMRYLLDQQVEVPSMSGRTTRSVSELVDLVIRSGNDESVGWEAAHAQLLRLGFKVNFEAICISNSSEWIKKKLLDTPWGKNHNKILMRIQGAIATDPIRFSGILQSRAVQIPITSLLM